MPQFFSPVGNDQTFDANGDPLNGGQIETYISGSSTPAGTFTSSNGTTAQPNPIILDSLGYPPSPIWLAGGTAYKFIIKNSMGVTLKTLDGISGINDSSISVSEWVSSGFVPTYISATSFSVPGDQRSILQVGRRLRTTNTAGIRYSGISVSSFGAGVTTVTVINDSGTLDSGLSIVEYGLISATNTSFPFATFSAASTIALTNDGTTNAAHYLTFADGTAGQENLKTDTAKLAYNPSTGALSATSFLGSGAALTSLPVLGVGQTWQTVTGSRSLGVTYTNSTGKPIMVNVRATMTDASNTVVITVGGVATGGGSASNTNIAAHSTVVPPGATYVATAAGGSLSLWAELR